MNPKVKTKWLAALRSGEFKQATGQLAEVHEDSGKFMGFCCLGVLCRVVDRDDSNLTAWTDGMPPKAIMDAAELPVEVADMLASANDGAREWPDTDTRIPKGNFKLGRKAKFTTIANYIERYL